jgi:hypothetical protein
LFAGVSGAVAGGRANTRFGKKLGGKKGRRPYSFSAVRLSRRKWPSTETVKQRPRRHKATVRFDSMVDEGKTSRGSQR